MHNMVNKLVSNVNYRNYLKLEDVYFNTANFLNIYGLASNEPICNLFGTSFFMFYLDSKLNYRASFTKDCSNLRMLYDEFLKDYSALIAAFEFDKSEEIFALFSEMLNSGYISKDKSYNYGYDLILDVSKLYGSTIFSGNGVCRHTSSLLADILNKRNIEASLLEVSSPDKFIDIVNLCDAFMQKSQSNELVDMGRLIEDNSKWKYKKTLNKTISIHAVTVSKENDKLHFFDPTANAILLRSEGKLYETGTPMIIGKTNKKYSYFSPNITNKEVIEMEVENYFEAGKLYLDTKSVIQNNMDLLEQFYTEHKELYEEATNIIANTRKKVLK